MGNSLQVVVFSFNRALQLEYTLRCLFSNLLVDSMEVVVIYHATPSHREGYEILKNEYSGRVKFSERKKVKGWGLRLPLYFLGYRNIYRYFKYKYLRNIKDNFKYLLESEIESSPCNFVMFSTDDNVFYRKQIIDDKIFSIIKKDPINVSFRCYVGSNHDNCPSILDSVDGFLRWNYYDNSLESHWAYPFSVDGTVYEKESLLKVIKPTLYHMPTTLEANIVSNVRSKKIFSIGYSPCISSMVGVMLNRVAKIGNDNRAGNYDPDYLNKLFVDGYRISMKIDCVKSNAFVPDFVEVRSKTNHLVI